MAARTRAARQSPSAAALLSAASLVLLAVLAGTCVRPAAASAAPGLVVKGAKPPKPKPEKFVQLRFYLQDLLLKPNYTAAFVVPPLAGIPKQFALDADFFGGVVVIDDPLTTGPSLKSPEIGRAKGFYVWNSVDPAETSIEFAFSAVFNEKSGFPGSTIQFRGFDLLKLPVREVSIAGGTGVFRLARGWAQFTVAGGDDFYAILNFTASVFYGGSGRYAKA